MSLEDEILDFEDISIISVNEDAQSVGTYCQPIASAQNASIV